MSTGPEHYRRAEQLENDARRGNYEGSDAAELLAAAQVHATLALAAATAMSATVQGEDMPLHEFDAWNAVCGVPQPPANGGAS